MNAFLATVISLEDPSNLGLISVIDENGLPYSVEYLAPASQKNTDGGGLISFPVKGDTILVLEADDRYFYNGTTVAADLGSVYNTKQEIEDGDLEDEIIENKTFGKEDRPIYGTNNEPAATHLFGKFDSGLRIDYDRNLDFDNTKLQLQTRQYNQFKLLEGSNQSRAFLGFPDSKTHLTITSKLENSNQPNSTIDLAADSNIIQSVSTGDIRLNNNHGGEIALTNDSNGVNSGPTSGKTDGDINLTSKNGDIVLEADSKQFRGSGNARCFINCGKFQVIVSEEGILIDAKKGDIDIQSRDGSILFKSSEDIQLECDGDFKLKSKNTIMEARDTTLINTTAGNTKIDSGAIVEIKDVTSKQSVPSFGYKRPEQTGRQQQLN